MKLGIIGSGKIVHDFLKIGQDVPGNKVVAISTTERSKEIGQELAKKYHIEKTFTDNEKMVNDPDVDTVYVAVPNSLHFQACKLALEAGKNVICEKPFVYTVQEADELKKIADKNDCIIMEAIVTRYLENFGFLKRNLPKISPVRVVNFNYTQYSSRYDAFLTGDIKPAFDRKKGGGALMDLNVYNIHVAIGLFGAPESVQYFPTMQRDVDTSGILVLTYPGMQASLIAAKDSLAPNFSTIEGEKGALTIRGHISEMPEVGLQMRDQDEQVFRLNSHEHRMFDEFAYFAQVINDHDTKAADEAFRNSEAVLRVLEKARSFIK